MIDILVDYLLKNRVFDLKVYDKNFLDFDFVLICSGSSYRHINNLCFNTIKFVKSRYIFIDIKSSGIGSNWIILDFDNTVLLHIMLKDIRIFYDLDSFYFLGK